MNISIEDYPVRHFSLKDSEGNHVIKNMYDDTVQAFLSDMFEQQAEINRLKKEPCKWGQDPFIELDYGLWNTNCGTEFLLTDGTPGENDMKYCPFCGGLIEHKGD